MIHKHAALRGLMAENDYTAEQLARAIRMPCTTFKSRISGRGQFRMDEAYAMLDLFRVPHSRLHEIFPPDGKKE